MKIIKFWIQEPYKTFLLNWNKTIEWRLNKWKFRSLELWDILEVEDWLNRFKVIELKEYVTFRNMLINQWIKNILPDKVSINDWLDIYYKFYSEVDEVKYWILSIKLEKII